MYWRCYSECCDIIIYTLMHSLITWLIPLQCCMKSFNFSFLIFKHFEQFTWRKSQRWLQTSWMTCCQIRGTELEHLVCPFLCDYHPSHLNLLLDAVTCFLGFKFCFLGFPFATVLVRIISGLWSCCRCIIFPVHICFSVSTVVVVTVSAVQFKQVDVFPYLKNRHLCVILHYLKLLLV